MTTKVIPSYVVLIGLNNTLMSRDTLQNQSNKNSVCRKYAKDLLKLLYDAKIFHIVIYSGMAEANAWSNVKKLIAEERENWRNGISTQDIDVLGHNETVVDISGPDFYISALDEGMLLELASERRTKRFPKKILRPYDYTNAIIIDGQPNNKVDSFKIGLQIQRFTGVDTAETDADLIKLIEAFKTFIKEPTNNLAETIKSLY